MEIFVMSADKWSMTDEKTGEHRAGTTVFAMQQYRDDTGADAANFCGFKPVKFSAPAVTFDDVKKHGVGVYAASVGVKPNKEGKPEVVLMGLRFVRSVNPFAEQAKAAGK